MTIDRLLPRGRHLVPGNGAINPTDNVKFAASRAADLNSPKNLESLLTTGNNNHSVMFRIPVGESHIVSEIVPSAPYTEEGLMICAGSPEELRKGDIQTQNIYDMPQEVQRAYWQLTLANLLAFEEQTPDSRRYRIMATENTTPRTSEEHRTSRTLAIPHIQINRFDRHNIQPEEIDIPSLTLEERILQRKGTQQFADQVYGNMVSQRSKGLDNSTAIHARRAEPYGYTLGFPFDSRDVLQHITEFQQIMQQHHMAYRRVAEETLDQSRLSEENRGRIIPQPSYRTYIFFDHGRLHVIISPEFISHAGVTEAAGVQTIRSEDTPYRFTQEELAAIRNDIGERVLQKIKV